MRADYGRNHEEALVTGSEIVSFFKAFEEFESDFRMFDSNPQQGVGDFSV
jgi:hypothetical protein